MDKTRSKKQLTLPQLNIVLLSLIKHIIMRHFKNQKKLFKTPFLFFTLTLFLGGCYYDNTSELYPTAEASPVCDSSATITYSKHISRILAANCVNCHDSGNPKGNVALDTYNNVSKYVSTGQLLGAIQHNSAYKAMPPNTQLDACFIKEFEKWIQSGAGNN